MDDASATNNPFGLREQPFAPTADPAYFFASRAHAAGLQRLRASIDAREGIAVVLGGYGTGKTTLLRELVAGMAADPGKYRVAVLGSPMPSWSSFELLEAIAIEFGLDPGPKTFVAYMDALNRYLIDNRDRVVTLIVDDAQNLNKRGQLEMLRLAQNLEDAQHKLLNIVLFAQLDWTAVLKAAPGFAQCIAATHILEPLQPTEVKPFIDHRLERAGAPENGIAIFDTGAIEMIQAYAEGNPRQIVTLCRTALLLAEQANTRRIGQAIVLQAIESVSVLDPGRKDRIAAAALTPVLPATPESAETKVVVKPSAPVGAALAMAPAAKALNKDAKANEMLLRAARARQSST